MTDLNQEAIEAPVTDPFVAKASPRVEKISTVFVCCIMIIIIIIIIMIQLHCPVGVIPWRIQAAFPGESQQR